MSHFCGLGPAPSVGVYRSETKVLESEKESYAESLLISVDLVKGRLRVTNRRQAGRNVENPGGSNLNSPLEIPSLGGVARSAGVGKSEPKTPLKSPLVQGGTPFSSSVAPHGGMSGSSERANLKLYENNIHPSSIEFALPQL